MTLKALSLFFVIVMGSKAYCNDSTIIKVIGKVDLSSQFYNCTRNHFLALVDTSRGRNEPIQIQLTIIISDSIVEVKNEWKRDYKNLAQNDSSIIISKTATVSVLYRLLSAEKNKIAFYSKEMQLANATSICNRERFLYYMIIDHEKGTIKILYNQSSFKRPDLPVFEGRIL